MTTTENKGTSSIGNILMDVLRKSGYSDCRDCGLPHGPKKTETKAEPPAPAAEGASAPTPVPGPTSMNIEELFLSIPQTMRRALIKGMTAELRGGLEVLDLIDAVTGSERSEVLGKLTAKEVAAYMSLLGLSLIALGDKA